VETPSAEARLQPTEGGRKHSRRPNPAEDPSPETSSEEKCHCPHVPAILSHRGQAFTCNGVLSHKKGEAGGMIDGLRPQ